MSNNTVIKIDNVNKSFKLPHERQGSIKDIFISGFKKRRTVEKQQVLNNISLEIKKGEFFGIVGRNGSGKSTLLKLMAGIYYPDKGGIRVEGKLVPFIELGVGFNPDLTGRENVFLNGALFGFSRQEMEGMYDEIVEFAELEKFMDQKLKNYSSGMQVRLAFSIAIQAEGDVLLLDEVLAVGDEAFQRKCFDFFEKLKLENKTVILVTHSMEMVEKFCSRGMLISNGKIEYIGNPNTAAAKYKEVNSILYTNTNQKIKNEIYKKSVETVVLNENLQEANYFKSGENVIVRLSWKRKDIKHVGISLVRHNSNEVFGANSYQEKFKIANEAALEYKLKLDINEGDYFFKLAFFGDDDKKLIFLVHNGPKIVVAKNLQSPRYSGVAILQHSWENILLSPKKKKGKEDV